MALSESDLRNIKNAAKIQKIRASQSEGTNSEGGYTVESQLLGELIVNHPLHGIAKSKCRQVKMDSDVLRVASVVSSVQIEGVSEGDTISQVDLSVGQLELDVKKLAARIAASNEIVEDWAAGNLPSELLRDVSAQMSVALDGSLFGLNSLFGGDIKGNAGVADLNIASAGALALTDLTAAKVAAGRVNGEEPEWYMLPSLYDGQVSDLLSAAGISQCCSHRDGRPRLLGLPVNLTSGLSSGLAASGDLVAVCGSMRAASVLALRGEMSSRAFKEVNMMSDQTVYQFTLRGAIGIHQPQHLSKITIS